ncbi:cytosine deaminase [Alcaligenes faecalis]|uniref:metal-dependent hydrolase family protein n=1 Tax=Alcaligenes faecalis TaxID=511 RepID=UPI000A2D78E5|nr:amidohydrolase family protein [Alcaligenes faecalis]OSZ45856.1 cytosine deaminase [Alcaligenes faecalis]OSZ52821.1 cytosine deaminase [Alcaligenes faecalis]OSZ54817.1 cytosine deaminase [Alcaligenes faecalis]
MTTIAITNVSIFDGSGTDPYPGEVLIEGNKIKSIACRGEYLETGDAKIIDGHGAFLMPGMTEGHTHFSWNDQPSLSAIQFMPPEEHILWCVRVAKRYLEMGWTSALGAATAKPRLDVVTRNVIEAGAFPGPRYLAGSQEITMPGGLGDNSLPHLPDPAMNFGAVCNGPEDMRRIVRMFVKLGVDHLKINLSGEYIAGIPAEANLFSEEEIAMLASEARLAGKRVAAHARSKESIKACVKHGFELVFHASYADEEALDMLEANKDKHFVVPGLGWLINTLYNASEFGITEEIATKMGYKRELEAAAESLSKMHKRGIRVLPGGDYGFAWMPHGTNARDLEYLVKYVGMTPKETLVAATKYGAELMQRPDELGQIKEGFLADIILIDGNPIEDLSLLQDPEKILMVMKDGEIFKNTRTVLPPRGVIRSIYGGNPLVEAGVRKEAAVDPMNSRTANPTTK